MTFHDYYEEGFMLCMEIDELSNKSNLTYMEILRYRFLSSLLLLAIASSVASPQFDSWVKGYYGGLILLGNKTNGLQKPTMETTSAYDVN